MGPAGRRCSWIWSPKVLSVQWSRSPLELNSIKDVRSSVKMYVKNHYMFRFHLIPLLFGCHVGCYTFRLSAIHVAEHEIIEPVGQHRSSPPRDPQSFQLTRCRCQNLIAASAGAAWAGLRRDPTESPQPGAIPTTSRSSWLKAMGKPDVFFVKTLTGHMSCHCVAFFKRTT